jgi:hypothetical protein
MSCRDAGNVFPFARTADGRFDLDRWNDAYRRRLRQLQTLADESLHLRTTQRDDLRMNWRHLFHLQGGTCGVDVAGERR